MIPIRLAFHPLLRDTLGQPLAHLVDNAGSRPSGSARQANPMCWAPLESGSGPNRMQLHLAFIVTLEDSEASDALTAAGIAPLDFDGQPAAEPQVLAWMPPCPFTSAIPTATCWNSKHASKRPTRAETRRRTTPSGPNRFDRSCGIANIVSAVVDYWKSRGPAIHLSRPWEATVRPPRRLGARLVFVQQRRERASLRGGH